MMSAMHEHCIGGLQRLRCVSAGTQDFCADFMQERARYTPTSAMLRRVGKRQKPKLALCLEADIGSSPIIAAVHSLRERIRTMAS